MIKEIIASAGHIEVVILRYEEIHTVELDEVWSFVQNKSNQRWLWLAIDHNTRKIIAYTFGRRQNRVFEKFQILLEPFGIAKYYTDDWCSYKLLPDDKHEVGKENTQLIERKNLTFRTRIKRLARKTICFSKLEIMHDIVIGLYINIVDLVAICCFIWCVKFYYTTALFTFVDGSG